MPSRAALISLANRFFEANPTAAAHSLEGMSREEAIRVLEALPPRLAAEAVSHIADSMAADLMKDLPPESFQAIVEKIKPEQGATIFRSLDPHNREHFLRHLSERRKRKIQELLTYPEDSAGRIMTTDFLALHSDLKVKEAIQKIRLLASKGFPASYLYVVDSENHLAGVINMRDLMLASTDNTLQQIMRTRLFSVNCFMDREKVAHELSGRRYFAVPVVDFDNRLIGIIQAEQIIGDVQQEATEDIQMMFGAGGDERVTSPMKYSLKKRLPWLHVNLATAFLAASVVALFEDIIHQITALAVFLPVVAGQGGNAGAQSLAIVMRGIVMREISGERAMGLIVKESVIGVINGLIIGLVTGLICYVWQGNIYMGIVIALGMMVNLTVAGLSGAAIPILMKRMGLDPAQCSNIILTTVTDVMGFFAFLSFAVLFREYLI